MPVLIFRGERGTLEGVRVPVRLGDCPELPGPSDLDCDFAGWSSEGADG